MEGNSFLAVMALAFSFPVYYISVAVVEMMVDLCDANECSSHNFLRIHQGNLALMFDTSSLDQQILSLNILEKIKSSDLKENLRQKSE